MDAVLEQVGDWIEQRRPGGYVHGMSRVGKSRCVQYFLKAILSERFDLQMPIVIVNHLSEMQRSPRYFWRQILRATNFEFTENLMTSSRVDCGYICKERFIALANSAEGNRVILLIDEAQDMSLNEWKLLVGLQNELDYSGYLLSVFSVGSHQMSYKHEYMAHSGNAHVASRFLAANTRFHGLQGCDELEYVLRGYDEGASWPAGGQISFHQHFSPASFSSGKRLADCAPKLWRALGELLPQTSHRNVEFPMQHISMTAEAMLMQLARGQAWEKVTSIENLLQELRKTNFSDHMRVVSGNS